MFADYVNFEKGVLQIMEIANVARQDTKYEEIHTILDCEVEIGF